MIGGKQVVGSIIASQRNWFIVATAVMIVGLQLIEEQHLFVHESWLTWSDQGHYMNAVRAWAALNLTPSQHHYPPGYALIAVPFIKLLPLQPFLIPDLICAAVSLPIFIRICEHLAPKMRHVQVVAALCFLLATSSSRSLLEMWAVPWTTTPVCPFLLGVILLALRMPSSTSVKHVIKTAATLGVVAGLGATFRPSDAVLLFVVCCAVACYQLLRRGPASAVVLLAIASSLGGLVLGLLPFIVAHIAIFGVGASDYLGHSAALGFEWRLIPMRWVLLVICPRPLLPEGTGMEAAFFWIWPGIAGLVLCVATRHDARGANALVASSVLSYWLFYLSYRDLHPYGLWRFHNVHYFKWTLPFLAFWTYMLIAKLAKRPTRPEALAALSLSTLLFAWRPEFVPSQDGRATPKSPGSITIPANLNTIESAIMIQAFGTWHDLYFTQPNSLRIEGQVWPGVGDIKFFPGPGGGLLVPLRRLPKGDITITLPPPAGFPPSTAWRAGSQRIVFGIPCLVTPRRGVCSPDGGLAWLWLRAGNRA